MKSPADGAFSAYSCDYNRHLPTPYSYMYTQHTLYNRLL